MGLNAASVHVRTGNGPEAEDRVAGAVRRVAVAGGYCEVESARRADRTIVLHPSSSGSWLTIFDSHPAELDALAASLSRETGVEVVCSSIEQSDAMRLALFRRGRAVDILTAQGPRGSGRPQLWTPLLSSGEAVEQFRSVLERPAVFAEDKLVALAGLLGLNRDLCLAHVDELVDSPGRPFGLHLHFRLEAAVAV